MKKVKDEKSGSRPLTESEKFDKRLLDALATVRGVKKHAPAYSRD